MIKTQIDLDYPKRTGKTAFAYFTFHHYSAQAHLVPPGTTWYHLAPSDTIWDTLVPSCIIQDHLCFS